jgi:hypothetical protein
MKKMTFIRFAMMMTVIVGLLATLSCKKKNPTGPSSSRVTCEAGCSSMSYGIKGEGGPRSSTMDCTRTYTASGKYVETCTGSVTFENSGKTYNFSEIYDWPNCKMSITVTGVGSCSDKVGALKAGLSKSSQDCHCDVLTADERITKYKNK